jgi:hypothetical protein
VDFRFHPQPDHLLVVATGSFDIEACRDALVEIVRLCREHALDKVLLDARGIAELVPIADRFDLARDVAAAKPPRFAILVTPANEAYTRMFERTAVQGGAPVKTTSSEAAAREFLGVR